MKIHQIYRMLPPNSLIDTVVNCFGITSLDNCNHYFCKTDLKSLETVNKINNVVNTLKFYYLPCKAHYMDKIDERKAVTILRQLIRLRGYCILVHYRYKNKVKQACYQIKNSTCLEYGNQKTIRIHHTPVVIDF